MVRSTQEKIGMIFKNQMVVKVQNHNERDDALRES